MSILEQHIIALPDARLQAFIGGAGLPAVCMTHPLGVESAQGNALSAALAGTSMVVLVNARGSGRSSSSPAPLQLPCRQLADDVEAARQRLRVGRWVAAGDSGGAAVALLYALHYPQALAGLILEFCYASLAPALADPDSRFSPLHPENQVAIASIPPPPPTVSGHTLQWVQLPDGRWLGWHEDTPWGIWPFEMSDRIQALMEELRSFDVRDRLAEIQLPTLVVVGRHDDLIPLRHSQLVADRIPDAQLVVLEHSGHSVAEEDGEPYRRAVQEFIAKRVRV